MDNYFKCLIDNEQFKNISLYLDKLYRALPARAAMYHAPLEDVCDEPPQITAEEYPYYLSAIRCVDDAKRALYRLYIDMNNFTTDGVHPPQDPQVVDKLLYDFEEDRRLKTIQMAIADGFDLESYYLNEYHPDE